MFGAFDIDSLQFETRCLLRRLRDLTGESEDDAIRRSLEERYVRLTAQPLEMEPSRHGPGSCSSSGVAGSLPEDR